MFGKKRASSDLDQNEARPDIEGELQNALQTGFEDLSSLFAAIEGLALGLYGAHGLPDQLGHYQRDGEDGHWSLISEDLTPAQKFDLILSAPEGERPRYAAHDRLGAEHPNADVRKAAALLAACRGLRTRLKNNAPMDSQTLADAIRLGALYQDLASGRPELRAMNIIHQPPPPPWDYSPD